MFQKITLSEMWVLGDLAQMCIMQLLARPACISWQVMLRQLPAFLLITALNVSGRTSETGWKCCKHQAEALLDSLQMPETA